MQSFLIVLLIIQDGIHGQNYDFRPTPIPLNEWHHNRNVRESRAGTLHETFETELPPSIAAVPAHYWEDALKHSVYLTLVQDKIKQLMTKDSEEIEDQGLWNKIKNAPFKRLPEVEPAVGEVTIMAKGRLLEDKKGFSFAEDEISKETCNDDKCMQGVKAFWSVKRVRQRDHETSPGKYHYELTFSVISQTPKKPKKLQENPIKTYTVRESHPKKIIDRPQEYQKFDARKIQTRRPERAIWFHKNIAPQKQIGRRQFFHGFDSIFSSLFSDDFHDYGSQQTKYKQNPYAPPGYQYSKMGNAGVHTDYQIPYPYRPNLNKPIRPAPIPPINPIQQSYQELGPLTTANSNIYPLYPFDQRTDTKPIKTTRPAVLPTPLPPISPIRDYPIEATQSIAVENVDRTTLTPDYVKYTVSHNKYKPNPFKVNYFSDHVRPPVYNAPPGVFVTMDKKPFKPMPPLKYLHLSKPNRPNRPIDFRPSPQVTDVQFSDPDSFGDTAFRPISADYIEKNKTSHIEITTKENKNTKPTPHSKKPLKKHEVTKSQHVSTAVPDIITAQLSTSEEIETLDWANVLGAFTKTTPMVSQTEPVRVHETTTSMLTTVTTTTPKVTSTTKTVPTASTTRTAPMKRTRPPPKYTKQETIKKHKRKTTTSTTTSVPENIKRRPTHDLTPQANSAATDITTGTTKTVKESHNQTQSLTSSSSTTSTSATTKLTTTTTTTSPEPTILPKKLTTSVQPKNKNRFRQSTLILKGTSVKHDRWNGIQKNQSTAIFVPTTSSFRRKGSNFQGYISTTPRMSDEGRGKDHVDRKTTTTSEANVKKLSEATTMTSTVEETVDQYETNSVVPFRHSNNKDGIYDELSNESKVIDNETIEKLSSSVKLTTSEFAKNKTKCKKKKQNISTTEQIESNPETVTELITLIPPADRTDTTNPSESTIDEIFNFNFDSDDEKQNESSSIDQVDSYSGYTKTEDDFEDLFNLLDGTQKQSDHDDDYDNNDDDDDEGDDKEFDDDEDKETARDSYNEESEQNEPFSFLELMSMS